MCDSLTDLRLYLIILICIFLVIRDAEHNFHAFLGQLYVSFDQIFLHFWPMPRFLWASCLLYRDLVLYISMYLPISYWIICWVVGNYSVPVCVLSFYFGYHILCLSLFLFAWPVVLSHWRYHCIECYKCFVCVFFIVIYGFMSDISGLAVL